MRAEIGFTLDAAQFWTDGTLNMAQVGEILIACAGLISGAAPVPAGGQFASDITDSRTGSSFVRAIKADGVQEHGPS